MHVSGRGADMESINEIANKKNIYVIEDAAHAVMARFNGKLSGSASDAACYSLYPNKTIGAASNGGIIITKKEKIFIIVKNFDSVS